MQIEFHSRLNKIEMIKKILSMGPLQGDRALLGGLEFGLREILKFNFWKYVIPF